MSLSPFLLLTFAISWGIWWPAAILGIEWRWAVIAGSLGPGVAALILAARQGDRAVRALLAPLLRWRAGVFWYGFVLLAPPAIVLFAVAVGGATGPMPGAGELAILPVVFLYVLVFSVIGEEIGWRGYALPQLLREVRPLAASLILGAIWGVWHLPLFYMVGNFHAAIPLLLFFFQVLAMSMLITWIWIGTGGSLFMVVLFHAVANTTLGMLPILPPEPGATMTALWIALALLWSLAALAARRLERAGTAS